MLCQKCHKKTASVFISSIINGQETRIYLCDDCVKDYPLFNFNFQNPFSIKDVMDKFKIDEDPSIDQEKDSLLPVDNDSKEEDVICPNCYSTYNEYKQTGKLGCSRCYEAFEEKLKPVLKNIYGHEEYIGKIPKIGGILIALKSKEKLTVIIAILLVIYVLEERNNSKKIKRNKTRIDYENENENKGDSP